VPTLIVQKLSVFILADRGLDLINRLFDKDTVLHIEDAVRVTLKLRVVSNHYARGTFVLSFITGPHSINIKEEIHHRYGSATVEISSWLIKQKNIRFICQSTGYGYSLLFST
jgi:hypothetical protein